MPHEVEYIPDGMGVRDRGYTIRLDGVLWPWNVSDYSGGTNGSRVGSKRNIISIRRRPDEQAVVDIFELGDVPEFEASRFQAVPDELYTDDKIVGSVGVGEEPEYRRRIVDAAVLNGTVVVRYIDK